MIVLLIHMNILVFFLYALFLNVYFVIGIKHFFEIIIEHLTFSRYFRVRFSAIILYKTILLSVAIY